MANVKIKYRGKRIKFSQFTEQVANVKFELLFGNYIRVAPILAIIIFLASIIFFVIDEILNKIGIIKTEDTIMGATSSGFVLVSGILFSITLLIILCKIYYKAKRERWIDLRTRDKKILDEL